MCRRTRLPACLRDGVDHAPRLEYPLIVDRTPKLDKARDEDFRRRVIQELQGKLSLEKGAVTATSQAGSS